MSCHNTELPRLTLGGWPYKTSQASPNLRSYFCYDEEGKKKKRKKARWGRKVAAGQGGKRNTDIKIYMF